MTGPLYDPIRRKLVVSSPEEKVRQNLLFRMLHELGYPQRALAVEQKIENSSRRADIVCYAANISVSKVSSPLIVIECKADNSLVQARQQVSGYNHSLQAPFFCLANQIEICTFWWENGLLQSVPFLPLYQELLQMAQQRVIDG